MAGFGHQSLRRRKRHTIDHTVDLLNDLTRADAHSHSPLRRRTTNTFGNLRSIDGKQPRTEVDRDGTKFAEPGPDHVPPQDGASQLGHGADASDSDDLPSLTNIFELREREFEETLQPNDHEVLSDDSLASHSDASTTSPARGEEVQNRRLQPLVGVEIPILSSLLSSPSAASQYSGPMDLETRNTNEGLEHDSNVESGRDLGEVASDYSRRTEDEQRSYADEEQDSLFLEASQFLDLEDSWSSLVHGAPALGDFADDKDAARFENINAFIEELIRIYTDPANQCSAGHQVPSRAVHNLIQATFDEAMGFLNNVCREAKKADLEGVKAKRRSLSIANLVDAFEAHVIPALALAACMGLRAHYADGKLHAFGDLNHVLKVLNRLCERIDNLRTEGCVKSSVRSRFLRAPLRRIIMALQYESIRQQSRATQSLKRRHLNALPNVIELDTDSDTGPIRGSQATWTHQEGETLLDGLKLYQGRLSHNIMRRTESGMIMTCIYS